MLTKLGGGQNRSSNLYKRFQTMESITEDAFTTEAGAINVSGYLEALHSSPRIADRLELCTVQLRDKSLILKEVDAVLKQNSDENAVIFLYILALL